MKIWPGNPFLPGVRGTGQGVNFALFPENATAEADLYLFNSQMVIARWPLSALTEQTDHVWHVYLQQVRPGQL
jgi:glycogen operon protein